MGKKKSGHGSSSSGNGGGAAEKQQKQKPAVAFVLKVPTHCRCDGCDDKVRAGVRDLARRGDGIVSLDQSALATKGELAVVATADPEKLRRRLSKHTGKSVDLVFPTKPPATAKPAVDGGKDAANVQALLAALLQQQQQQQAAAHAHYYGGQPMHGGGYGLPAAYPWVVQQQQQAAPPPEPYYGSWGAYPHDGGVGGAYGGGGGGWFGY